MSRSGLLYGNIYVLVCYIFGVAEIQNIFLTAL